jgi:hypothetical protein
MHLTMTQTAILTQLDQQGPMTADGIIAAMVGPFPFHRDYYLAMLESLNINQLVKCRYNVEENRHYYCILREGKKAIQTA